VEGDSHLGTLAIGNRLPRLVGYQHRFSCHLVLLFELVDAEDRLLSVSFDSNAKFELTCPQGHRVPFTLQQGRRSETVRCPTCGQEIQLEGSDFDKEITKAERALKDFGRRMSRRFKS
jgi:uncharacterized C2H2 Zn-finger protein